MEPDGELLYKDKESLSLRAVKIYACLLLAAFLLIVVVEIYGPGDSLMWITPLLSLCMVLLLSSGASEIWISDGHLYRKRVPFNFFPLKPISISDILYIDIEPQFERHGISYSIEILTNVGKVSLISTNSHEQAIEITQIINSKLASFHLSTRNM